VRSVAETAAGQLASIEVREQSMSCLAALAWHLVHSRTSRHMGPFLAACAHALAHDGLTYAAPMSPVLRDAVTAQVKVPAERDRTYTMRDEVFHIAQAQWRYQAYDPAFWQRAASAPLPGETAERLVYFLSGIRAAQATACKIASRGLQDMDPRHVLTTAHALTAWPVPAPAPVARALATAAATAMQELSPNSCARLMRSLVHQGVPDIPAQDLLGLAQGIEAALTKAQSSTSDVVTVIVNTVKHARLLQEPRVAEAVSGAIVRVAPQLDVPVIACVIAHSQWSRCRLGSAAQAALCAALVRSIAEAPADMTPHTAARLTQTLPNVVQTPHQGAFEALVQAASGRIDDMDAPQLAMALSGAGAMCVQPQWAEPPDGVRAFCSQAMAAAVQCAHIMDERSAAQVCIAMRRLQEADVSVDAALVLALAGNAQAYAAGCHPAHALLGISRFDAAADTGAMSAVVAAAQRCTPAMSGVGLVSVLQAIALLQQQPSEAWQAALVDAVARKAYSMDMPLISRALCASQLLRPIPQLQSRVLYLLPNADAVQLAYLVHHMGLATCALPHIRLHPPICSALMRALPTMPATSVARLQCALARLSWFVDAELRLSLRAAALRAAADWAPRQSVAALYGLAHLAVEQQHAHLNALDAAVRALERHRGALPLAESSWEANCALALDACACIRVLQPDIVLPEKAFLRELVRASDGSSSVRRSRCLFLWLNGQRLCESAVRASPCGQPARVLCARLAMHKLSVLTWQQGCLWHARTHPNDCRLAEQLNSKRFCATCIGDAHSGLLNSS
jgi:hypothetical protein